MSIFSHIRGRKPKKNKFDLSHERKFSFNMGELVPILVQDIVPGDKFRVNSEVMLRMAPMLAPIMHRVNVTTHYFFVPNRLLWNEWEDFITGGREGTSEPVAPFFQFDEDTEGRFFPGMLPDFMGVPTDAGEGYVSTAKISALPFRAYSLIWDEYYRDQNLTESLQPIGLTKDSGKISSAEASVILDMKQRAWEKDYFTSALPWAQRGGEVGLAFDGVTYKDASEVYDTAGNPQNGNSFLGTSPGQTTLRAKNDFTDSGFDRRIENIESIDGITVNELRRSIRLQEWLEKNARGGARYVEQILSHFGVKSSDARLQRPEYLGGGKQPVQISEVLSTFQDTTGNPQGNMAGHGIAVGGRNGFNRFFEEHGYVIGLMSVLPKTAYQQGVPRHLTRFDRFDYFWPEFAQIGEQEVKNKELYFTPTTTDVQAEGTFGYQSRYAEYKYQASTVHGEMRDSLSFWHMGRIFSNAPTLSSGFVLANPTDRIFAVQDPGVDHMYCQLYNSVSAIRPMPYFGTPIL